MARPPLPARLDAIHLQTDAQIHQARKSLYVKFVVQSSSHLFTSFQKSSSTWSTHRNTYTFVLLAKMPMVTFPSFVIVSCSDRCLNMKWSHYFSESTDSLVSIRILRSTTVADIVTARKKNNGRCNALWHMSMSQYFILTSPNWIELRRERAGRSPRRRCSSGNVLRRCRQGKTYPASDQRPRPGIPSRAWAPNPA